MELPRNVDGRHIDGPADKFREEPASSICVSTPGLSCVCTACLVLSCLAAADPAEAVSLQRVDRVLSRVMGRSVSDRAAFLGRSI